MDKPYTYNNIESLKPMISVVVPVYNAADYISVCIESILYQNVDTSFEIICVNDGSKDNSLEIISDYASKHKIIKVINQPNLGVTAARKAGVLVAEGEWIYFVDSDDSLPNDSLKIMCESISDDYDIIIGEIHSNSTPIVMKNHEYRISTIKGTSPGSPVAKLFRKFLFSKNTLDIPRQIVYGEDMIMNIRLAFQTEKAVFFNGKKVYQYNLNQTSTSHIFRKTPEYEELFHEILYESIPPKYRRCHEYSHAQIANKINAWKCLNLLKLSTKAFRNSNFYHQLMIDIKKHNYVLKWDEWIQVNSNCFPLRIIAIALNLCPIFVFRTKRLLNL